MRHQVNRRSRGFYVDDLDDVGKIHDVLSHWDAGSPMIALATPPFRAQ
jgi:hypothetical protein